MEKMSHRTLLYQSDVGKASVYGYNIPSCKVGDIAIVEDQIAKNCLGRPFMDYLKSKMIDYSKAKAWKGNLKYLNGDKVILHNCFWVACQPEDWDEDTQGVWEASGEPKLSEEWKLGEKFEDACLNELWCHGFLFNYLDIMMQIHVAPELSMPLTASGWRKNTDKQTETLSAKEINLMLNGLKEKAGMALDSMHDWIMARLHHKDYKGCFDLYKPINENCCNDCGCNTKRCKCESNCIEEQKNWDGFAFA